MPKIIKSNGFGSSAGNTSIRKADTFDRLYKALAILAVVCVIAPFFYAIVYRNWLTLPLTAALAALGYLLQSCYGKIAGVKRGGIDASYENMTRFFSIKHCALSCTAAFILSLIAKWAVDAYLKWRGGIGMDFVYDSHSLYPYLAMIMVFLTVFCGIFCWFFPYDRVISTKTVFPLTAAFLIAFFVNASSSGFITLSLIIYIFCVLVILNQSYISRAAERTKTSLVTPSMRLSGIAMIAVLVACAAGILILITAVVVGVTVSFKALLYLVLASVFRGEEEGYTEASDAAQSVGDSVFNMSALGLNSPSSVKGFFILFAVILLGLVLLFIISRKYDIFKKIGAFFAYVYQNIIEFLSHLFAFGRSNADNYAALNYKDVEHHMKRGVVREYIAEGQSSGPMRFRDYQRRLSACKTQDEKLNYAYNTLVACWKDMNFALRPGDTPREIEDKVSRKSTDENLSAITRAFENMKYSSTSTPDVISLLHDITSIIKRHLD